MCVCVCVCVLKDVSVQCSECCIFTQFLCGGGGFEKEDEVMADWEARQQATLFVKRLEDRMGRG